MLWAVVKWLQSLIGADCGSRVRSCYFHSSQSMWGVAVIPGPSDAAGDVGGVTWPQETFLLMSCYFSMGEGGAEEVPHDLGTRVLGYLARRVGLSSQENSHFPLPPVSAGGDCSSGAL